MFSKTHVSLSNLIFNRSRLPLASSRKLSSHPYSEPSPSSVPLPHPLVNPRSRPSNGYRPLAKLLNSNSPLQSKPKPETNKLQNQLEKTKIEIPTHLSSIQQTKVSDSLSSELSEILQTFKAPIRYAMGYGSGVFTQKTYDPNQDRPMLDFIFAVTHPDHWHSINLQQNPKHYALPVRCLGSGPISWLQDKGPGAGIWFNVQNEVNGKVIKYGVISVDTLCNDLLDWNTLYVSGRMQKPVYVIRDDARIRLAQQVNLASALRTALLILPQEFTETELYMTITGLSYTGDFRMKWGEHPHKIENIVDKQLDHFQTIYRPLIQGLSSSLSFGSQSQFQSNSRLSQDLDPRRRAEHIKKLPRVLKEKLETDYHQRCNLNTARATDASSSIHPPQSFTSTDEISSHIQMITDPGFDQSLRRSLSLIVGPAAFNQSVKGLLSAGPIKSVKYAIPKRQSLQLFVM